MTLVDEVLSVLLVLRDEAPFAEHWALPGGFKRPDETLNAAAARVLVEQTGVTAPGELTQLGAYGDPGRDSRTNVVSVAYIAAVVKVGKSAERGTAAQTGWWPADEVAGGRVRMAFDHRQIVREGVERVRAEHSDSPSDSSPFGRASGSGLSGSATSTGAQRARQQTAAAPTSPRPTVTAPTDVQGDDAGSDSETPDEAAAATRARRASERARPEGEAPSNVFRTSVPRLGVSPIRRSRPR